MKKTILSLAVVVLLSLTGSTAFAQSCDDGPDGPYIIGSNFWFDYSESRSCYSTNGNVSETETCFDPGWSFGTGSNQWATVTFTMTGDSESSLDAGSWVTFNDPTNSNTNVIIIDAYVDHPSGPDDYYQLFSWDGTDGDFSCQSRGGNFPATDGDIVTVSIVVGKGSSSATIEATVPLITTQ